ncbi:MAG TPA: hypothetical protein VMJ10_21645, partial [Kofleriaceae bacterium]|nr:hypothetical protein [Kofleriaceae bacterium]
MLDGTKLSCWGDNPNGELGQGMTSAHAVPVEVAPPGTGLTWKSLVGGDYHACGEASDDHLYCWGYDGEGAIRAVDPHGYMQPCSSAQTCDAPLPTAAPAQVGVPDELVAGLNYTCDREGATVNCWGDNSDGEIGNGQSGGYGVATVAAPAATTWTKIFGGDIATCGMASGQLACWGDLLANDQPTAGPTSVTLLQSGAVGSVQFGNAFACAVRGDGSRVCWGSNPDGELGDGTTSADANPTAPQQLGVGQIVVSNETACELVGGGVECWGYDD